MDALERFVNDLSDEDFEFLNRNRAFARQLKSEHADATGSSGK